MTENGFNFLKSKFLWGVIASIMGFFCLSYVLDTYTDPVRVGGFSSDTAPKTFILGERRLVIPQNMLRFREQRRAVSLDNIDLFMKWPSLQGFSTSELETFRNAPGVTDLIFVTLKNEGSLHPPEEKLSKLYRAFFSDSPWRGPGGLVGNKLDNGSIYVNEDVLYASHNKKLFLTRCLRPVDEETKGLKATCLYEFSLTDEINAYVRFDRNLLSEWRKLETEMRAQLSAMIVVD